MQENSCSRKRNRWSARPTKCKSRSWATPIRWWGTAANDLALVLQNLDDYDQAEVLFRESIDIKRAALGDHNLVAVSLNNLAGVIANRGRYQEAEAMYRESLDINQRLLGDDHPDTSYQLQGLASTYVRWGKTDQAIDSYRRALEVRRNALGEAHPITVSSALPLAELLAERGDRDEAHELLQSTRSNVLAEQGDASIVSAIDEALATLYGGQRFSHAELSSEICGSCCEPSTEAY